MAGRPAKPIDLLLMEGKKHLTKAEIETRKTREQGLRSGTTFRANEKVRNSPVAMRMFRSLKRLYKDIEYVDGLDEAVINRYCLMTAEIDGLETLVAKMHDDIDECEEAADRVQLYKTIANAEITINRIRDMLLKIEDRLFLNPTSRVKNVPRPQKEEAAPSKWDAFRGGKVSG
jgi:phage terminase small subunit